MWIKVLASKDAVATMIKQY
jgi:hypothetical protein